MSTFLLRLEEAGPGPRLAVKDLIDVAGTPTTAGCPAVAATAKAATADAACLAGARAAGARIVGKTNLHELAYGATGVNRHFGTPVNPRDPALVPGGSSSGSAVAVATGEADVALGTDSGGSVRIPAACCGVAGLKTTWSRIPRTGVWPLAPSLDSVGPMARDMAGIEGGMRLLEPTFTALAVGSLRVGRFRLPADPDVDAAVDDVLAQLPGQTVQIDLPGWPGAHEAARQLLLAEAWSSDGHLPPDQLGRDVQVRLRAGREVTPAAVAEARTVARRWRRELADRLAEVDVIALPTLVGFPPRLDEADSMQLVAATAAVNLAGLPALALPVPAGRGRLASIQLLGPDGGEELLVGAGRLLEQSQPQM